MVIDTELLAAFCDEAADLLLKWESICLEIAKAPQDSLFQDLFRIAHNLKGGSRAVGLLEYGDFVHKIEDGITLLRDGKIKTDDSILSSLLKAQNILLMWTEGLKSEPTHSVDYQDFVSEFTSCFQSPQVQSGAENAMPTTGESTAEESGTTAVPQQTLQTASAIQIVQGVQTQDPVTLKKAVQKKPGLEQKVSNQNETIRISASKLDQLIQTIGELSIHQSIIWHTKGDVLNANKVFLNSVRLSQKLTNELYDKALSLRMQPLHSVFQRMERNILDLSRSLHKDVDVQISGGEVELDKTVIERIVDPLTHLVRNAIDHGIEASELRRENGKKEKGRVSLSAHQDTFGVEIRISDDGRGLNPEKIMKKAIEKKLISEGASLSRSEMFQLIFLPGFSTAEQITDVSGRGVGMDVVRRTLDELQGSIVIESEENRGTAFVITLPTSVSIIDAMLVSISSNVYVLPVGAVDEVINSADSALFDGKNMMNFRGQILPVLDLSEILSRKGQAKAATNGKKSILVCRSGKDQIGFFVDKVVGRQQIVIRPLNDNIDGVFGILGGTILGNGEPGLIIDIPSITQKYIGSVRAQEMAA